MAYICLFNATRKKVVGHSVEAIRESVVQRFPDLKEVNFSMSYFDKDVNDYLDFDNKFLPPVGATLRIAYDVFATDTEEQDRQESETQFDGVQIQPIIESADTLA